MKNSFVDLTILVKHRAIPEFHTPEAAPRTFVEGRPGSAYEIQVRNLCAARLEIILSVDGLSIMDGKPAGAQSHGYVINGSTTMVIPGWRLDAQAAAQFVFAGADRSYNSQMGQNPVNIGVIGLLAFSEKTPSYSYSPLNYLNTNYGLAGGAIGSADTHLYGSPSSPKFVPSEAAINVITTARNTMTSNSVGTGFGEATTFATTTAAFNRNAELCRVSLYYDNRSGLKKRGIVIQKRAIAPPEIPNPFPAEGGGCVPPAGWQSGK